MFKHNIGIYIYTKVKVLWLKLEGCITMANSLKISKNFPVNLANPDMNILAMRK